MTSGRFSIDSIITCNITNSTDSSCLIFIFKGWKPEKRNAARKAILRRFTFFQCINLIPIELNASVLTYKNELVIK